MRRISLFVAEYPETLYESDKDVAKREGTLIEC